MCFLIIVLLKNSFHFYLWDFLCMTWNPSTFWSNALWIFGLLLHSYMLHKCKLFVFTCQLYWVWWPLTTLSFLCEWPCLKVMYHCCWSTPFTLNIYVRNFLNIDDLFPCRGVDSCLLLHGVPSKGILVSKKTGPRSHGGSGHKNSKDAWSKISELKGKPKFLKVD